MNEPRDPNETRDEGAAARTDPDETAHQISADDLGSLAAEPLELGLAAAFGKSPGPPRSSIGDARPVVLKEAEGESALVVRPTSDAMPSRATATSSPARSRAAAWGPCYEVVTSTSAATWP